jgi:hypothetical protein
LLLVDLVDPELAALAGVFGDGFAVLAGDGDFHGEYPGQWTDKKLMLLLNPIATRVPR